MGIFFTSNCDLNMLNVNWLTSIADGEESEVQSVVNEPLETVRYEKRDSAMSKKSVGDLSQASHTSMDTNYSEQRQPETACSESSDTTTARYSMFIALLQDITFLPSYKFGLKHAFCAFQEMCNG